MIIELVYVTIHYRCGCSYARPVQPPRNARETYSRRSCKVCQQRDERKKELAKERVTYPDVHDNKHYLIDGYKMALYQRKGYWYARRVVNGKDVKKYLGKTDPRPLLEAAS